MTHIPDEAVQAALDKWFRTDTKHHAHFFEEMKYTLAAALPHLSAPYAVEVEVPDDESLQAQISEIGNQIHNLSCEYQNNEPLSERLRDIRGKLWDISKRTTKPVDVPAGLERAAIFIDQRIADYVREHGMTDPETGTVEFPGWGDEYVGELEELAEGIRVLSPAEPAQSVRPLEEWHEDHGNAVWWTWDNHRKEWLGEPAYIGKPLDSDWPDYHTHWTPHPAFPAAPTTEAGK